MTSIFSLHNGSPISIHLDPSANKQPYIYGAICTVYALAVTTLALRIKARRISRACLGADDFLLVTSLVFATAQFIDMLLLLHNGLGQHLKSLSQFDRILKMFLFSDVTYYCTLAFAKYSILLFYWRIFGHVKAIHWPIYILLGLTTGWFIEVVRHLWHIHHISTNHVLNSESGCHHHFRLHARRLILEFHHQGRTLRGLCQVLSSKSGDKFRHRHSDSRPPVAFHLAPSAVCSSEGPDILDVPVWRIVR